MKRERSAPWLRRSSPSISLEHDANEIWSTQLEVARQAMEADSGIKLTALKVDGGASANNYLM